MTAHPPDRKTPAVYHGLIFIILVMAALAAGALLAWPLHLLFPEIAFGCLAGRGSLICGLLFSLLYVRLAMPFGAAALGLSRPAVRP